MSKLTRRSRSQQMVKLSSTNQNNINSISEDDFNSKCNTRSNSIAAEDLHSDNSIVLSGSSSVSKDSGQNSNWWKNLSGNDNLQLPNKLSSLIVINKSNGNPIEEQMYQLESDENESTGNKKISIFASQDQKSQKHRFSKAFHLNSEEVGTQKEFNTESPKKNIDAEVFKNTVESPVLKTKKTNKKRRTKTLFPKKKKKRKYSDAFITPTKISEKHASPNKEQNNLLDEKVNESFQKNTKELFKLDNKKKKYAEALLNIWDDDQEEYNSENANNTIVLSNTPDESIQITPKELFKNNSKKKKYSEAFLNVTADDESELDKQKNNSTIQNLSDEKSKVEKKSLFKTTFKNRKYSQAFISDAKDNSSGEEILTEEIQTQKDSSVTSNSNVNVRNKRESNIDIIQNNIVDESVRRRSKGSSKKKKYSEAFLNVTADDESELDKQKNNSSIQNLSDEKSKEEKKSLFKTTFKNRKYSQAFISDAKDNSSGEEILTEEIQTQKDSSVTSNSNVNVRNKRESNIDIIQNNIVDESVQRKSKGSSRKKKYSEAFLNVTSDDGDELDKQEKYSTRHNLSEEPSKVEKKSLLKSTFKNRNYSQAFISGVKDDSKDEEIVIEQKQKDSSVTSNSNVNVRNRRKSNIDIIQNNTVDESVQRKTKDGNKKKKYSEAVLNVTSDYGDELDKPKNNSTIQNLSEEPSKVEKKSLFKTTFKNRKYSQAFISGVKGDSSDEEIFIEEIQTQKDSSVASNSNINVTNRRKSNIDVIQNNIVDESIQRKTKKSSKKNKKDSSHVLNEEQEKNSKKGEKLEIQNVNKSLLHNQSQEINKNEKVSLFKNDSKSRYYFEDFVLSNNSDDSSDEEIIEEIQTQKDSSFTNNKSVKSNKKTNSFRSKIKSPSKTNSPVLRSASKINTPFLRSTSKMEKELTQVHNKRRKSKANDSSKVKGETSSVLKEINVIQQQKESLNDLKNTNVKYSQAFMELIAMSKPDTEINVADEAHKLTVNDSLSQSDSESRFSSIPSIDISSELKHPLFHPKVRKEINSVKSINENKNKSKVQSDQEQILDKSRDKSSTKVNSSKFTSLLESDFNPILSSTKVLINFNEEKSTGSDESIKKKQQRQNKLQDNETSEGEKDTIKDTPSKLKRKTNSLTTVPENPENVLVSIHDSILETQVNNNKNSTTKKSTSFKSKTIPENGTNENENRNKSISSKNKLNSISKIVQESENKKKDGIKTRRRTKSATIPENIEIIPAENELMMETNQVLKEFVKNSTRITRSASMKSIETISKTNSEKKDTLKKKLSIVRKTHPGSVSNESENYTGKTKGTDIVDPENREKVFTSDLTNIFNNDKINAITDVPQKITIEQKSRNKSKGKSESLKRTDSVTVDSSILKTRSSPSQITEQESKISSEKRSIPQRISEVITINSSTSRVRSSPIEQWLNNSIITGEVGPEEIDINKNGEISPKELNPIIEKSRFDSIFQKSKRKLTFENNNILYRKDMLRKVMNSVSITKPPTQATNTKITDFFSKLGKNEKIAPIPKSVKSVRKPATVSTARLVDGKPYYSKKLFRGKHWCNPSFYKFLQKKLSTEYGEDTINESENVMKYIFNSVNIILKSKKYIKGEVENLKRELARHGIIVTTYDFYCLCYDYLPVEYTDLVVPQTLAYHSEPTVPYNEETVFKQIIY